MSYARFFAMIATSTVVMFALMYLNTYVLEHVYYSQTRTWMALLMGATMAIVMMSYMWKMYENKAANVGILLGSALVFAASLWLVRSQATVGEVAYMTAMIPHHSIAVLTSERAQIEDPRVRKLADEIIAAQRREISEMRFLVAELRADGSGAREIYRDGGPEIVSAAEALGAPELARVDLQTLSEAEIGEVLPAGSECRFAYTVGSPPILAIRAVGGAPAGVVKIHGHLVELHATERGQSLLEGPTLSADGLRVSVEIVEPGLADLRFELEQGLSVGYRGPYTCGDAGAPQG